MSQATPTLRQRVRGFSAENRYGFALLLIVVTYVLAVASPNERHLNTGGLILLQLATVWLVFSISDSPRIRRIATVAIIVAGLMSILGGTIGATLNSTFILDVLYATNILLYAIAPVAVIRHALRRREVDLQTLMAALCAYLLIGMMFAFTYRFIGRIGSIPFFGDNGPGTLAQDLFFSFITLTTTGYGDLVPVPQIGQSLAVLEALIGQFFLAGVVAKIVTAWRPRQPAMEATDRQD